MQYIRKDITLLSSLGLSFLLLTLSVGAQAAGELDASVPKFIDKYCMGCHDIEEDGDRNFEILLADPKSAEYQRTLSEILEQLTLKEMPPKKKRKQPTGAERALAIEKLMQYLDAHKQAKSSSTSVVTFTGLELT